MLKTFTAKFTRIESGYMGQLVEWPEVVTEGKDIDECRDMLRDALNEMILAYHQQGKEIPVGNALFQQIAVEV
jgi:predicted RNase H-like HicB family nuclease